MLNIQCPSCEREYRVADEHRGRQVRCQTCGNLFPALPYADSEPELFAAETQANSATPSMPANVVSSTPPAGQKRANSIRGGQSGSSGNRIAHEIDYEIHGDDMQYCEIILDPQETVIAEAGAMMYMTRGVEMQTVFGNPSKDGGGFWDKVMSAGKRALTGESLFMTTFTNSRGNGREIAAFGAPYAGKILPMHLDQLGGEIICQKDAFLCGAKGIEITIAFQKKISTALFGGEGFIMQRLVGDGIAMVHASGAMMYRDLAAGEQLRLDTGCLMAVGPTVSYDVEFVGGIKNTLFGGEGLFMATVTGPGPVWLQSLPFSRLAGRILKNAGPQGGKGEGSVLDTFGGLGGMFMGDNK